MGVCFGEVLSLDDNDKHRLPAHSNTDLSEANSGRFFSIRLPERASRLLLILAIVSVSAA